MKLEEIQIILFVKISYYVTAGKMLCYEKMKWRTIK